MLRPITTDSKNISTSIRLFISNLCAGINRHVAGDEKALQERSSEPS
jgi:hypothetical protein